MRTPTQHKIGIREHLTQQLGGRGSTIDEIAAMTMRGADILTMGAESCLPGYSGESFEMAFEKDEGQTAPTLEQIGEAVLSHFVSSGYEGLEVPTQRVGARLLQLNASDEKETLLMIVSAEPQILENVRLVTFFVAVKKSAA